MGNYNSIPVLAKNHLKLLIKITIEVKDKYMFN